MNCDKCSSENPEENFYCGKCGALISLPPAERLFQRGNLGAILILVSAVATAIGSVIALFMGLAYPQFYYNIWILDVVQWTQNFQIYVLAGLWVLGLALVLREQGAPRIRDRKFRKILLGSALLAVAGDVIISTLGNTDIGGRLGITPMEYIIPLNYYGSAISMVGTSIFLAALAYILLKPSVQPNH